MHKCALSAVAVLWLGLVGGRAVALRADDTAATVDSYVEAERVAQHIPGLALLVVKDGQVVKSHGYGLANVEHDAPVTSETIFQSGSVGKQFTAAGVMLLVEDGKLALDDPVAKHLQGTPEAWQAMTVRHLLSHTSGLGDYAPTFDLRRDYTEDALLRVIYGGKLAFQPGESWSYSNLGYATLGILIHKGTGQHYGEFLAARIFRPLGMTSTRIINEADIIPRRAAGYRLADGQLQNQEWVSPTMNSTADGSLYFNLVDLAKWDAALGDERLLKRASLDAMWTPATLAGGQPNSAGYGFGWFYKTTKDRRVVEHGGAWQGFTTFIARYLDDNLTVIVLTNLSARDSNPGKIARNVAGLYVPALTPPTTPIEDKEPEVTARLRALVERMAVGKAQEDDFVGEAKARLFPDGIKPIQARLTSRGKPRSFALVERNEAEGRIYRYRAEFAEGPETYFTFRLDADGKVASLAIARD